MHPIKALVKIRDPDCTHCSLHSTEGHVCVMGRGNPKARLVLIGEAPGAAEELTGKPFMGHSGQLLNRVLKRLGLEDDCYITNVAKCRPPSNRTPTDQEVKICAEQYMIRELMVVHPHVTIALGKTSGHFLKLTNKPRGVLQRISTLLGFSFIATWTWHPAYCTRMGAKTTLEMAKHIRRACRHANLL